MIEDMTKAEKQQFFNDLLRSELEPVARSLSKVQYDYYVIKNRIFSLDEFAWGCMMWSPDHRQPNFD